MRALLKVIRLITTAVAFINTPLSLQLAPWQADACSPRSSVGGSSNAIAISLFVNAFFAGASEGTGAEKESFLERQMRLAAERWESGEAGMESDEYDGYGEGYVDYFDAEGEVYSDVTLDAEAPSADGGADGYEYYYDYEDAETGDEEDEDEMSEADLEWARRLAAAKAAPKRKASGFKRPESPRPFSGIVRPIAYDDFVTDTSKALGCVALANDAKLALLKSRVKALSKAAPEPPKPEPAKESPSSRGGGEIQRKQSLKEKQEQRRREKEERAKELAKRPEKVSVQLGADCETLVCGACKAVVEEFAHAIYRTIDDPSVEYLTDLLGQQYDFCGSKEVHSKYGPLVGQACGMLLTLDPDSGLREALLRRFESTPDGQWASIISPPLLYQHKRDYCLNEARLCTPDHFELQTEPARQEQEDWTQDCYVCRKMMADIEETTGLYVVLKDEAGIVQATCDRLQLQDPHGSICTAILQRESFIDDVAWLAKVNHDAAQRRETSELDFATSACAQTALCPDPRAPQSSSGSAEMEVEAPYW